jgi:glucarate dehydratase
MRALAGAFPGMPLRIDPNGAWSVQTSKYVAGELAGVLEYLEDPTLTTAAMAEVAAFASMPLATNMCVVSPETVPDAVRLDAVQIVLSDHHYWGGLRHTRELGAICDTFGLGMSMHSNSHLGISLAAMTHVAAATPNLAYACDTHYPWNSLDDVVSTPFEFVDGALAVPTGPGLGVSLNEAKLAELNRRYVESGRTTRADTAYMRLVDPSYDPTLPRF